MMERNNSPVIYKTGMMNFILSYLMIHRSAIKSISNKNVNGSTKVSTAKSIATQNSRRAKHYCKCTTAYSNAAG